MAEMDLSKVWLKSKELQSREELVDLNSVVRGRSKDTLQWIKIILWIEFSLNIVVTPLIYVWWRKLGLTWQFYVLLSIIVIYLVYYIFLINAISKFDFTGEVKKSLKKIYSYLSFYLLHYKVVIWLVFPLSFAYGLYLGMTSDGKQLADVTFNKWLLLTGIAIAFNAVMIYSCNKLIDLIYGRKIKRLKVLVKELEDQ